MYRPLSGQYPAQGFFTINENSGDITIIRPMKDDNDNTLLYILEVKIYSWLFCYFLDGTIQDRISLDKLLMVADVSSIFNKLGMEKT